MGRVRHCPLVYQGTRKLCTRRLNGADVVSDFFPDAGMVPTSFQTLPQNGADVIVSDTGGT